MRGMQAAIRALPALESELVIRWLAGISGPLRLDDGRILRVVFPGVAGGGAGPDIRDALIEVDGDLLRGDIEMHLRASGWYAHGHHRDTAYHGVVLHVVAMNDTAAAVIPMAGRLPAAILTLDPAGAIAEPSFVPPCVFAHARGTDTAATLERMGERRLRIKAARLVPFAASVTPGQLLYAALLEILGGPANRAAFSSLARSLPLAALLERAQRDSPSEHEQAIAAELRLAGAALVLRNAGQRPLSAPGKRLDAAAAVIARCWPGLATGWPEILAPGAALLKLLQGSGIGRAVAIEIVVNAVLPAALALATWPEAEVVACWHSLPAPGTYGKLKRLGGWLAANRGDDPFRPFTTASRLQGGLLLHTEYCTKGRCGRCPLSCSC